MMNTYITTLRHVLPLALAIVFIFMLASCAGTGSVEEYSKRIYEPEYAEGFEILGDEGKQSVILSIHNPWQGAKDISRNLFIGRGGEEPPAGFKGEVLNGDAKRIVAMSSTQTAMLQLVGAAKNIVGVSGLDFISSSEIQSRRGEIADIGYDGNIDYERLLALKPDIVLLYGVNGMSAMEPKLKELGIPFVYIGDYLEESPLGKAEWMVAVAEIVGKRIRAEEVFSPIPKKYNQLKTLVSSAEEERPSVMLNAPYGDSWFMPPAGSYMVTLLEDAGAVFPMHVEGNSSKAIDIEEAYMLASDANYWINLGSGFNSISDIRRLLPKFANVKSANYGRAYNNTLRSTPAGGNDFFESGVVNPDLVLRDLIKIFHPQLLKDSVGEVPFVYYKPLPLEGADSGNSHQEE